MQAEYDGLYPGVKAAVIELERPKPSLILSKFPMLHEATINRTEKK